MAFSDRISAADMQKKVMDHWDLINRLAAKRFHRQETAEEAALYVLDKLAESDWRKIRSFKGKSKFSTFLSSVSFRLFEDFSRKRFGRVTPPSWLKELGGIWLSLFRLLCLERFSFAETILKMSDIRKDLTEKEIEESAEHLLKELPNCGKSIQEEEYDDQQVAGKTDTIKVHEDREKELILKTLSGEIFGESYSKRDIRVIDSLVQSRLSLKAEEQILLKLRFREGLSVAEIGKILGLNRFQVNGRLRRTLEKIKKQFKQAGCEEELRHLIS